MKKIFLILLSIGTVVTTNAQFKTAMLQASGLTCAMCTKAINKSLEKLSFIQSINPDIKNSAFNIQFKQGAAVNIDQLKTAVQDAGFSVAKLKLTGFFTNVEVKNDEHVQINGNIFHFVKVNNQTLDGTREITVVDKNFVSTKEFNKFSEATKMTCVKTGQASACCTKDGITDKTRVYHVTI